MKPYYFFGFPFNLLLILSFFFAGLLLIIFSARPVVKNKRKKDRHQP